MTLPSAYCEVKCGCAAIRMDARPCRITVRNTSKLRVVYWWTLPGADDVKSAHVNARCVDRIRILRFFRRLNVKLSVYKCFVSVN